MKTQFIFLLFLPLGVSANLSAQNQEAQQLLLNVEKLAQLKQILSDMKKGYTILSTGYNTIKDLSEGNYRLHQAFLDGLLAVNPTVRNYQKISGIINYQVFILQEYKKAYNRFRQDKNFNPKEIKYLQRVYTNLFRLSLQNLDELASIITANQLRMSDEERLNAIDRIYQDMLDKLIFLRHFNHTTTLLAIQRAREQKDVHTLQKIYGLN
ncbi:TerB family tellurite resistance protein [Adhaeribacter rhizoryzae]|uniref:TerB family tellurite resistance protein n=1 Tax=Adhaeribacter rhizoryzae TaxID=2607907 RepID=A0A5M6DPC1_9BACT|nr:TerB family tellurite resistance protein [Adhaeribacter rhizoryzae]KAA5548119.1 TerB family tellurite resistance protein [Adhaeribacter rhizoryzae]